MNTQLFIVRLKDWRKSDDAFTACIRDPILFKLLDKKQNDDILFRVPYRKVTVFKAALRRALPRQVSWVKTYSEFYEDSRAEWNRLSRLAEL